MTDQFLPFALPDIGEREIEAVAAAMRSGWLTTGPSTKKFEERFAEYLGAPNLHCIAVNSATSGLHLALEAIGIGPGDEVIAPSMTFTASVEIVRYLGGNPVIVDVDDRTLNIDPNAVRKAITSKTKAILPVHYAGLACDMAALYEIAEEYGLKVVEDAAHALPTSFDGKRVGTLSGSSAAVFSFYANKTITTGEGGMVVTDDADMAHRMRVMRLHGIDRDAFDRFRSEKPSWYYEVIAPGYKYNLTDIASSMGIVQLERLGEFHQYRQMLADRYYEKLAHLPLKLPSPAPDNETHAWHLFVVRLTDGAKLDRTSIIQKLSEKGIGTSVHYVPLHRQPYWRDKYDLKVQDFPIADAAYEKMFSIPLYTKMTIEDQDRVIDALEDLLG